MTPATPESAFRRVEAFERVPLGEAYAAERDAAIAQCSALRAAHYPIVFHGYESIESAVLLGYQEWRASIAVARLDVEAIALHEQARQSWPALARNVRGPFGRRDVLEAARTDAARSGRTPDEHAAGVLRRFEIAIAAQLVDDATIGESARILADVVPTLKARITAVEARHQAHIAGETARRAAEDQARREALDATEKAERENVAQFFEALSGHTFYVRGALLTGSDCAALARGNQGIDRATGVSVRNVTLDDLQRVRRQRASGDDGAAA